MHFYHTLSERYFERREDMFKGLEEVLQTETAGAASSPGSSPCWARSGGGVGVGGMENWRGQETEE